MPSQSRRFVYAFLVVPLLLGAKGDGCSCRKQVDTDTEVVDVQRPEVTLQVVSIDPSTAPPDKSFGAYVYGAGFESGATVKLGDVEVGKASVQDANTIQMAVPALAAGSYDVVVTNPDGTSAKLRQGLLIRSDVGDCRFVTVNFDFDQAGLTSAAKSTLDGKMECYRAASGSITVEGHADERGTTEYNLALGERRAETVKTYLSNQGVAASRVNTVSFGEERPVARGHDESAWAQNRRADVHVGE